MEEESLLIDLLSPVDILLSQLGETQAKSYYSQVLV